MRDAVSAALLHWSVFTVVVGKVRGEPVRWAGLQELEASIDKRYISFLVYQ